MRIQWRLVIALVVALFAAAPTAVAAEKRVALLIGNEDYPPEVGRLDRPSEDVDAMRGALRDAGFDVAVVPDADRRQMLEAVEAFRTKIAAAGPDTIAFFYYAGHGAQYRPATNAQTRNYLFPARTKIADPTSLTLEGVRLDSILEVLSGAGAKSIFVVIDACRNTLAWSPTRGGNRGLQVESTGPGMLIAFSTSSDAAAPDDGVYATKLAQNIRSQRRAYAERIFDLTAREVARTRGVEALPTVTAVLQEDFCFHSCPQEDNVAAPLLTVGREPWQCALSPTEYYQPGWVFRVDTDGVRHDVGDVGTLDNSRTSDRAASAAFSYDTAWSRDEIAAILGVSAPAAPTTAADQRFGVRVQAAAGRDETSFDTVRSAAADLVVRSAPTPGSRYFVIRRARLASAYTYKFEPQIVDLYGGESAWSEAVRQSGIAMAHDMSGYALTQTLPRPARVCVIAEELRIASRPGLGEREFYVSKVTRTDPDQPLWRAVAPVARQ